MSRRALYLVAAVASAALLVALAVDLTRSGHHRTGANGRIRSYAVNVRSGKEVCQPGQGIEAGSGRVRFYARGVSRVSGPLEVSVRAGGQVVGRGTVAARPVGGEVQLAAPFGRVEHPLRAATVCIANRGPKPVLIMGEATPVGTGAARLPRPPKHTFVVINLDFQYADAKSWLAFSPTVADRFGLAKATFFGAWTFWLALGALLALALGTIWWTARTLAR